MKLVNEIVVPAAPDEVWEVLLDVARIAPCLPGASVDAGEGGEYHGRMAVKLGPISSRFEGTIQIAEADEAARRAVLRASARDSRGRGTAAATITSTMAPADEGTRVRVETDMRVTGPAAQFGRGVMQDVSAKLMGQFAECLAAEIGRAAPGAGMPSPAQPGEPAASGVGDQAASAGTAAPPAGSGVAFSSALPPDAPAPPPTAAGVRWPDGVTRPPGERPDDGARPEAAAAPEVLDLGEASREAVFAVARRALPAVVTLAAAALAVALWRRRAR